MKSVSTCTCNIMCMSPIFSFVGGHGNSFYLSFHETSGRDNKLSQLRYTLCLLLSMCEGGRGGGEECILHQDTTWILQDLHEQGAISLIIGIMERGREGGRGLERRCTCIHSFFLQLGLLKDIELAPPTGSHGNLITLEIESDALLILSYLCENNIHSKVKIVMMI